MGTHFEQEEGYCMRNRRPLIPILFLVMMAILFAWGISHPVVIPILK